MNEFCPRLGKSFLKNGKCVIKYEYVRLLLLNTDRNRWPSLQEYFLSVKADDTGGLSPGKKDNADRRKIGRKEVMGFIRD